MGALEALWRCLSGKPSVVAKSGLGDTRAVKSPPSFDAKLSRGLSRAQLARELEPGLNALFGTECAKTEEDLPKFCRSTMKLISRKKGATINEIHKVVGKSKGSIYNHIYVIRGCGFDVVKDYDKKSGSHRYRLG